MGQTYFSKQTSEEKAARLSQLATSVGGLIIWKKGEKTKYEIKALRYEKDEEELYLQTKPPAFKNGDSLLCSFDIRGMSFFATVLYRDLGSIGILKFPAELFKSERRASYRLLTYPIYQVWADFKISDEKEAEIIDLHSKKHKTDIFRNFLKLMDDKKMPTEERDHLKIRVQDLSTTGMAIHISEQESKFFEKGTLFTNVKITFEDEVVEIPEARIVYLNHYTAQGRSGKVFKAGIQFAKIPTNLDIHLGKKITSMLREVDANANKDFETFLK